MGNHTPGPWIIDRPHNEIVIKSTSGGLICNVNVQWMSPSGIHYPTPEEKSNASLIAAAPEMLDMLIGLQESAQYWSEYGAPFDIINRLNAVISKAKGEE